MIPEPATSVLTSEHLHEHAPAIFARDRYDGTSERFQFIHTARGWELLRELGYRSYVPRPRHRKADPEEQDAWKKNCPT
jgi:transposase